MRTLRAYLALIVVGALLPGTLLTGALVWRTFNETRGASERKLLESARVDAAALGREFDGVINTLGALATSPTLDHDDFETFHAEASRVQASQPGWYSVVLLSVPDERQLLTTRQPWGTRLQPALEPGSLRRLAATGRPTVGGVRPDPRGGATLLFPVRVPVVRDGQLKFALSAIIDVRSLERLVPGPSADSGEWTRAILDADGIFAVRTRGAESFVGGSASDAFLDRLRRAPESVEAGQTREGVPVYAATSPTRFGWTTIVVVQRDAIDGPLSASMVAFSSGGLVLMACGLLASLWVARRLSSDLKGAMAAAEAVAAGRAYTAPETGPVVETRRLQRALASASALLQQRARERDEELRRAEQASQVKDHFLAVLGHELRNPLAPALTALELMKAKAPETCVREREVLQRQIAHMTRLVNDLLDVSRLTRGRTELIRTRFELREAVNRAVDMVQPLLTQHGHGLEISVPADGLALDGDLDRIVQVLTNLLTNAARYTPRGGRLTVRASRVDNRIVVACEDNGPGVPPEFVPALFERFAQGPRTPDQAPGGLGLGLALAQSFTELHGGTIAYEPLPEGGSRFIVTFPAVERRADPLRVSAVPEARISNPLRVLVVDDNEDAAEMLQTALAACGHSVETAGSGPVAIALARLVAPDVAVLDIGLPGMDGYELARLLRQSHPDLVLIALSGYGQPSDVANARAAGFVAHFTKPASLDALLAEMERWCAANRRPVRPAPHESDAADEVTSSHAGATDEPDPSP